MDNFGIEDLASELMRLTQSPRIRQIGNRFGHTAPAAAGPMSSRRSFNSGGGGLGDLGNLFSSVMPSVNGAVRGAMPRGQNSGGSLGSALGSILGSVPDQLGIEQQDPLASLYEQLLGQLQSPVQQPQAIDKEDLMNQVRSAINPIYDQRSATATAQSKRAQSDIQGMYGALSKDYEKLAPQQIAQAQAAQDQIKQMYGELRSNIEGTYSRVSDEQSKLFQQLGIQDALPDVLGDQNQAVTDASVAASENQAQQQQRYMDIGQMDSTYFREGAPNAILQGNEVSSSLLADLQDYLQQNEAERASGIQSGYLDQLGQAQSQLGQQQQAANSESARRQEMLWQMLQSQLQGQSAQQNQKITPDTYMGQLPPEMQQSVAGAFTQIQRSPEAVYGKVEDPRSPVPGTYVEITPEWYMSKADQMFQQGKIDPVTHQALLMYMQLYFGLGNG